MGTRPSGRRGSKQGPALLSDWPPALTHAVEESAHSLGARAPSAFGERRWDTWYARAIAAGLTLELAALGRATMREAIVSRWDEAAWIEAGVLDDGEAMIELACADPELAEQTWSALLESEGRHERELR